MRVTRRTVLAISMPTADAQAISSARETRGTKAAMHGSQPTGEDVWGAESSDRPSFGIVTFRRRSRRDRLVQMIFDLGTHAVR